MDRGLPTQNLRFEWLNPTRVLNWGYAMYVASEPKYRRTTQRQEALLVLEDYKQLRDENLCLTARERVFISGVRETAISYANGIPRKNLTLKREMEAAERERSQYEERSKESENRSIPMRAIVRYVPPSVFAGLGVLAARIIGVVLPEEVTTATGKTLPQVIAAIGLAVIWMYAVKWWTERAEARIDNHYNSRVLKAIELHELGRDNEIAKYTADAVALWVAYTGKQAPKEWSSFRSITREEIRAAEILRRKRRELEQSNLDRLIIRPVRKALGKMRRKKKNGKPTQQQPALPPT